MRAEEWEDVKRIFESALKFSETQRAEFLAAACRGRNGMQKMVEELLRAHENAAGFLADESLLPGLPPVFSEGQLVDDRFRIIRLISRGGMGEVYEAFDERLSIKLALKTLRPEYASDLDALERFRREIRVTRDFSHPNLCRVHELVEHHLPAADPAAPATVVTCLTMQLMSGETLQKYLARVGPLTPHTALPLIRQIAAAIEALHSNGIIHRDLKPSNIMINEGRDGELRAIVMDFGLAKSFDADRDLFESRADFQAGAPFFAAPELLKGEKPSVASDIYALGLIIDEMVTRASAFSGTSVEAILYQKVTGQPIDPRLRAPNLPESWCHALRRCLATAPEKRFPSTQQLLAELNLERIGSSTRPLPFFYRAKWSLRSFRRSAALRLRSVTSRNVMLLAFALLFAATTSIYLIVPGPPHTSVLVFPFENWTGKSEFDSLSKGMTSEIIRRLTKIQEIDVIPFGESPPPDASVRSHTRFSIEGHLQSDHGFSRLSVQVAENRTGKVVWSDNFDANRVDSLEMQSDIALGAVDAMRREVLAPDKTGSNIFPIPPALIVLFHKWLGSWPQPAPQPTVSAAAMQAYMRGRALSDLQTLPDKKAAIKELEKALQEDANFALAYAELSAVQLNLIEFNYASRTPLLKAAKEYADQAVAKGPDLAEAFTARAAVRQNSWDWQGAEQDFKHAILLNPKWPRAHRWYGGFLMQFGRFEEGLKETRTAVALDPYDYAGQCELGTFLFYAGKPREAVSLVQKSIQRKDMPYCHQILGFAYAERGYFDKGPARTAWFDRALKEADLLAKDDLASLDPDAPGQAGPMYALFYALRGDRSRARAYLNKMLDGMRPGIVNPQDIAAAYLALGDKQAALDVLKSAVAVKDSGLLYLKVDPFLEPLRSSPDFKALLAQTGL